MKAQPLAGKAAFRRDSHAPALHFIPLVRTEAQWAVGSRKTLVGAVLFACLASNASAQTPRDDSATHDPATPHFAELVVVRPTVRAEFDARVLGYLDLRAKLADGLPAQQVTDNPADIIELQRKLAKRIRRARRFRGGSAERSSMCR